MRISRSGIFLLLAVLLGTLVIQNARAAKCDFDGLNGDYPDRGDISALAEGIVNQNLTCTGGDCDLDGNNGGTPDVGDLAALLEMVEFNRNTGDCKKTLNFPKGEIWVPANGLNIVDPIDKTTISFPAGSLGDGGFVRVEEADMLPDLDDILLVGPALSISLSRTLATIFTVVIPKHLTNERVASDVGAEIEIFLNDPTGLSWRSVPTRFNSGKNGYEGVIQTVADSSIVASRKSSASDPTAYQMVVGVRPMQPHEQGCSTSGGIWNLKYCECPLGTWWNRDVGWGSDKSKKGKCVAGGSGLSSDAFSFLTWNVGNTNWACPNFKLCYSGTEEDVSRFVKKRNPDIVFMQELFPGWSFIDVNGAVRECQGGVGCVPQIERVLSGYEFACSNGYGKTNDWPIERSGRKGNGWECVAYKPGLNLAPNWSLPDGMPEGGDEGQDLALIMQITKNGKKVSFINVHAASPLGDADGLKRTKQMVWLDKKLKDIAGGGGFFVLAGDFNTDASNCFLSEDSNYPLAGREYSTKYAACIINEWKNKGISTHASLTEPTAYSLTENGRGFPLHLDYVFSNLQDSNDNDCQVDQNGVPRTDHRAYFCQGLKWPTSQSIPQAPSAVVCLNGKEKLGSICVCPSDKQEVNGVCQANPVATEADRSAPTGVFSEQKRPEYPVTWTWQHNKTALDADFYRVRWSTSPSLPSIASGALGENEDLTKSGQKRYEANRLESATMYYFQIYACRADTNRNSPQCDKASEEKSVLTHPRLVGSLLAEASIPGHSVTVQMNPGEVKTFQLSYRVEGKDAWTTTGEHPVFLGTDRDPDRPSPFSNNIWLGTNRPTKLVQPVQSGGVANFVFAMQAPAAPGDYRECFSPVAEGLTWIAPNSTCWNIHVTGGSGTPIPSADPNHYKASDVTFQDPNAPFSMFPGATKTVTLKYRNDGQATWYKAGRYPVRLGTDNLRDRKSSFCHSSWIGDGCNRPAALVETEVPPGGVGTFTFTVQANASPQASAYKEYFAPVVEGLVWMKQNHAFWPITVGSGSQSSPIFNVSTSSSNGPWSSSASGAQGATYYFRGTGFAPGATVRHRAVGISNPSVTFQQDLTAASEGSVAFTYVSSCTSSVQAFDVWLEEVSTGRTSNHVTETVTHSGSCP